MSSLRRPLFSLLIFFLVLAGCTPATVETQTYTPTSVPFTEKAAQPTVTNTAELPPQIPPTATNGTLVVEFVYTGQWYRETFNYQPTAANIRHLVLVMPVDSDISLASPGWVFSNLAFTPYPEPFTLRPEATGIQPLLKDLYDAPAGLVDIILPPGMYKIAVAFIAAALPRPGDDAILYPGVTGGGASNDFHEVEVQAGQITHVSYELTDENGWGALNILALK